MLLKFFKKSKSEVKKKIDYSDVIIDSTDDLDEIEEIDLKTGDEYVVD